MTSNFMGFSLLAFVFLNLRGGKGRRPASRADEARLSGAGRFVVGDMKSYEKSERTVNAVEKVPWVLLEERPKGLEPGWLCEVSCALGSVQTVGESDALRQWYQRWQKQSQRTQAKASASSFQLKSTRQRLRAWQSQHELRREGSRCPEAGVVQAESQIQAGHPAVDHGSLDLKAAPQ